MTRPLIRGKAAAFLALAAFALVACSPVPRSTLAALHAFDLSTVSAGDLRLAVRVPSTFVLAGGAPELTVTVVVDGQAPEIRNYTMSAMRMPPSLAGEARDGMALQVYGLDARSAADLDAYLAELRRSSAPGTRQLALGLAIEGCRNDGASGRLPATTFIQLSPDEPFLVLTRPMDIGVMAALAGAEGVAVPAC